MIGNALNCLLTTPDMVFQAVFGERPARYLWSVGKN